MQEIASRTGKHRQRRLGAQGKAQPRVAEDIVKVLKDPYRYPSPVRPVGASSGNPRCTLVQEGTALDMSKMNRLIKIRPRSVTVQAGMRLRDLVRELAEHDLELTASFEEPDRTVGGLVSSGCLAAGPEDADGGVAHCLVGLRIVTPEGRLLAFDERHPKILMKLRGSFGLVGVIYEVSLRVRRIRPYSVRSRKLSHKELRALVPTLSSISAGVKIYLLPFRNKAYIELRESTQQRGGVSPALWRMRDWLGNRLLPELVHAAGRVLPGRGLRGSVVDGFSQATQVLVNTRLVDAGTNAMEQTGKFRRVGPRARTQQCTWYFSAEQFATALDAYRDFCVEDYHATGYRCDLPAVVYRVPQDARALLSPSFDGPAFALNLRTTDMRGWENFLIDFAEVAGRFGGVPVFNQTRCFAPAVSRQAYAERLDHFRAMRRHSDPKDRMINQYFREYIG